MTRLILSLFTRLIDEALGGMQRGSGTLVDGIEGIGIEWPGFMQKVECDEIVALYDPQAVDLANQLQGVAFKAIGVCVGHSSASALGAAVQIAWEADTEALDSKHRISLDYSDCADWDSPKSIWIA